MSYKKVSGCMSCGFPCLGKTCPHNEVFEPHCDNCGLEANALYNSNHNNNDYICEECYDEEIRKLLYEYYKKDWCLSRGYSLSEIDEEIGINGECYVCFEEFLDNEYQDDEYIETLARENNILLNPEEIEYCSDEYDD